MIQQNSETLQDLIEGRSSTGGAIQSFWPTRVAVGFLPDTILSESISEIDLPARLADLKTRVEPVLLRELAFFAEEEGAADAAPVMSLLWRFEMFREGGYRGLSVGTGRYEILLCLGCQIVSAKQRQSGRIFLYDPRIGSGNVFAPGIPFGRPMVFDPAIRLLVIYPAYIQFSIAPVHGCDWMCIASVSAS